MKKYLLFVFLSLCGCLGSWANAVVYTGACGYDYDEESGEYLPITYRYTYDASDPTAWITLYIYGTGSMDNYSLANLPPWYGIRDRITQVAFGKFTRTHYYDPLEVYLSGSYDKTYSSAMRTKLNRIGNYAFAGCTNLVDILWDTNTGEAAENILPCDTVGAHAFDGCPKLLGGPTFFSQITTIEDYGFANCPQLSANSLGTINKIGSRAFDNCTGLTTNPTGKTSATTELIIPSSVTYIGPWAFNNCQGITSISFDGNTPLTSLNTGAFANCSNLKTIYFEGGLKSIGNYALSGCTSLTTVQLRNVQELGTAAFSLCGKLNVLSMDKVTTIGDSAFYKCSALGNNGTITLPSTLVKIGRCAFSNCDNFDITAFPSSLKNIGTSAFEYCDKLGTANAANSNAALVMPSSMILGNGIFAYCKTLKHIDFNAYQNITYPSYTTFMCPALTNVDMENSNISEIGQDAFSECVNLKTLTLPQNLSFIGVRAFRRSGLTSITLPEYISSIGLNAFQSCTALKYIEMKKPSVPTLSNEIMNTSDYSSTALAVLTPELVTAFKAADIWKEFKLISAKVAPTLTSSTTLPKGSKGVYYFTKLTTSSAYPVALNISGTLPSGLSYSSEDGTIYGTPTVNGTFTIPATVSNDYGSANVTLSLTLESSLGITIGTTPITTTNCNNVTSPEIFGDNAVSYDNDTHTLTLNNSYILAGGSRNGVTTAPSNGITIASPSERGVATGSETVKIVLVGDNVINTSSPLTGGSSIYSDSPIEIYNSAAGSKGTLTCICNTTSPTVDVKGNLKLSSYGTSLAPADAIFDISSDNSTAIHVAGDLITYGCTLKAYGEHNKRALQATGAFQNTSGIVTATTGANLSSDIAVEAGAMSFSQGTVNATTGNGTALKYLTSVPSFDNTSITNLKGTPVWMNNTICDNGVAMPVATIETNVDAAITTTKLPNATVGESYDVTLTSESTGIKTWTLESFNLPKGLVFENGRLHGVPTESGTGFSIDPKLTCAVTTTSTTTTSAVTHLTMTVNETPQITMNSVYVANKDAFYNLSLKSNNALYTTWTVTSGSLPDGLKVQDESITGTPTTTGTYPLTLQAATSTGATLSKEITIKVMDKFEVGDFEYAVTKADDEGNEVKVYTCKSKSSVTTPDEVTYDGVTYKVTGLEEGAFISNEMSDFTFSSNTTTIGSEAFAYCPNLTTLDLPSSVTNVESLAFDECTSLTQLWVRTATPPTTTIGTLIPTTDNSAGCTLIVPVGSKAAYLAADNWKDFGTDHIKEYIELDEDASKVPMTSGNVGYISLKRTFAAGVWNTLLLPCDLDETSINNIFGSDTEVAQMAALVTTSGNDIAFSTTKKIEANRPCLIKPSNTTTTLFRFPATVSMESFSTVVEHNYDKTLYVMFGGSYAKTVVPQYAYFISDNKFYQCTAEGGIPIKGTRAYILAKNGSGASSVKGFGITINGEPTSIDDFEEGTFVLPSDVYTLDGRMVRKDAVSLEGLPKGIYIQGGKKVVVK